ncbi:MAG: hypothetical protein KA586_04460 [Candidatus Promineofilum sp.]|nr:hypothetical protein [Promineifilum sp.]
MDRIYLFLIRNDVWIYIVSILGLFWYSTEFFRAVRTLRQAMFNLEKETATASRSHALGFIIFFSAVIGIVFYVNRNIAPNLPERVLISETATPDLFATPLRPPTPIGTPAAVGEINPAPILAPTVTLPFSPDIDAAAPITDTTTTVAGTPAVSPTPFEECNPELTISEPLNGSLVFQRATFRGTANTGELHQFLIELNGPQTGDIWARISDTLLDQPIIDGDLGQVDLSAWQVGPYRVRLTALDASGQNIGSCTIQVTLDN